MGEHDIASTRSDEKRRAFMKALLEDVQALERMLGEGRIESGIRRIGAEQEIFLVGPGMEPANIGQEVLEKLDDEAFTSELALFNLEANLSPCEMGPGCLSQVEEEITTRLRQAREVALACDGRVVLVGILPTLELQHLGLDSMTPSPRYYELNRTMSELRGGDFRTLIKGLDELHAEHDNVMLEACNTSFQIHFQVGAEEFADLYNLAQAVTGPVLAAAVNSPILLEHRLWHETRVALFQQSLDARSKTQQARGSRQRVSFGEKWVEESVLEIFREDIARFRVLIAMELDEKPNEALDRGEVPSLSALRLHNGTVYRWNRPCYGVNEGIAHLRIENRVLPAGPSVVDEVANAAFFFGLMTALGEEYGLIKEAMSFDDAKANFMAGARYGLKARFQWVGGKAWNVDELILEHLLPLAHDGLLSRGISDEESGRYLQVIEDRVRSGRTGAQWALDSLAGMDAGRSAHARLQALTAAMIENQERGAPVHEWPLAEVEKDESWVRSSRTVGQVMAKDLFTVHPEDLVDFAANLMEWEHIRHVPVEDIEGRLVGIVTHRSLLRLVGGGAERGGEHVKRGEPVPVREIMTPNPISVSKETTLLEAMDLMRERQVSCLPVVDDGKLVGMVTEHDFMGVAARLLEEHLRRS